MASIDIEEFTTRKRENSEDQEFEITDFDDDLSTKLLVYVKVITGQIECFHWIQKCFERVPEVRQKLLNALSDYAKSNDELGSIYRRKPTLYEIHHVCRPKSNASSNPVTPEDLIELSKVDYEWSSGEQYSIFAIITSEDISSPDVQLFSKIVDQTIVLERTDKKHYPLRVLYVNDGDEEYIGTEWLSEAIQRDKSHQRVKKEKKRVKDSDSERSDDDEPKYRRMEKKQIKELRKMIEINLGFK